MKDLDQFLQSQIARIRRQLAQEHTEIQTAPAQSARHAEGAKKPSLSQLEKEEEIWLPKRLKL